jgi:predicted AlkP superfamily phosphohydrolase/phosphomutase
MVLVGLLGGLFALLTFPVRFALRSLRRRRALRRASVRRVVVLGLDGLDPHLVERWMSEGRLPSFTALARRGSFQRLRTTYPSISPVAWSSFMTGVDASRHNIFDFLNRDLRTYRPDLSSVRIGKPHRTLRVGSWLIPLSRPAIRGMRRSRAFWSVLGEHRIPSNILRVPLTFPPERFAGLLLSAMCIPDLRGTQGSFTYYTTDPAEAGATEASAETTGGERRQVELRDGRIEAAIDGPEHPLRPEAPPLALPFSVEIDRERREARLRIGGRRYTLREREYTPWVRLRFKVGWGIGVHGIARFYLARLDEHVGLYVTPIHIDPGHPALPISWPGYYSVYLARLLGEYGTLGLAEDTWALNERVIDEQAFLEQTLALHAEREAMFENALEKSREGVVACVFDGTDRLQHMFFRYLDDSHPANRGKDTERFKHAIRDMYERVDALIGRVLIRLAEDELLIVLSDHGFQSFRRGVNLNSWLLREGLLVLREGAEHTREWFADVDWSRTQAYAFGLGGIYVNQAGREAEGCVAPGEATQAIKKRIIEGLSGILDPEAGQVAIREVFDCLQVHGAGPYRENGPDLIVGYDRGYRASWEGAVGRTTQEIFTDNTKSWSGDHCVDPRLVPGVLFSSRRIRSADPSITDLAPTLLTLFGVDVPAYMTGRALEVEPA